MKLIVDSGSTKAAWYVALPGSMSFMIRTAGINPVRDDLDAMRAVVGGARVSVESELVLGRASSLGQMLRFSHVYFYGAGCIPPYSGSLCSLLQEVFPEAEVAVESDLLGAARALCGHAEGIACILGTGANSCLYDGRDIARQTPALGWILGDEGSGAVLGRLFMNGIFKNPRLADIRDQYLAETKMTQADIIKKVYREPMANRFLASTSTFIISHLDNPIIHQLVVDNFRQFFRSNIEPYGHKDLPVHFVGSMSFHYHSQLEEAAQKEGYVIGQTMQSPMEGLIAFHA